MPESIGARSTSRTPEAYRIAAVQAAPVFMDREGTVEKACSLIAQAAREGARLVVFPEAFVPGYPVWAWSVPPHENDLHNAMYAELVEQAVSVPDAATERLGEAAREAGVFVAMGVNERNVEASGASLYNTLLLLGPDGEVVGKHRKLVPTGPERLVWAPGDGSTLQVFDTPLGRIGALICWENYMPLARYALYAWGTQVYLAPTWDQGEPWHSTLRHIAKEGRCYVVGCSIAQRRDDIPERYSWRGDVPADGDWINAGDSAIVAPSGEFLVGPVHAAEEILFAEVDLKEVLRLKRILDVAGHYARPDVFQLTVRRQPQPLVASVCAAPAPPDAMDVVCQDLEGA